MAEWFVVRKGKEHGPFQDAQLKSLATSGKLKEEDQVRRSDQKSTVAAKTIGGLFGPALSLESPPPAAPTPAPSPATAAKKSGIWMKVVYFLMFCVIVSQVLKMIALMTGDKNNQQVASKESPEKVADGASVPAKTKREQSPLTLTKGTAGPGSMPLTADYLPKLYRPITFTDSRQDPRTGEPYIVHRTVLKPLADGYEKTDYDLTHGLPPTTKTISQEERAGAIWDDGYPLVFIGATVGDSWVHEEKPDHRFVFIGYRAEDKRDAIIEKNIDNNIRDRSGSLTRLRETIVLRKGEGIMLRRTYAITDGTPDPHPVTVIQRVE